MKVTIDAKNLTTSENKLWRGMGMVSGNNSSRLFIILSKSPTQYKQKGISVAADARTFCKGEIENETVTVQLL